MKRLFKKIKFWLRFGEYKQLFGLLVGVLAFFVMFTVGVNLWINIAVSVVLAIISIIAINMYLVKDYTDDYIQETEKYKYISKEEVLGKYKNVDDIVKLDDELIEFLDKYSSGKKPDYFETRLNKEWEKHGDYFVKNADEILKRMNNYELMITLAATDEITHIVDIYEYFHPFTIDIDYLIKHPEKANEYFIEVLNEHQAYVDLAVNDFILINLIELQRFEELEEFILSQMSNEELYKMASESKFWDEKLYYYGFMDEKKNKRKK